MKTQLNLILETLRQYKYTEAIELTDDDRLKNVFKIFEKKGRYATYIDKSEKETILLLENIGSPIIPLLIEFKSHYNFEVSKIAMEVLYKLGWEPNELKEKLSFYESLELWDKLVDLGEIAIPILVRHYQFNKLSELGQVAVPALIEAEANGGILRKEIAKKVIPALVSIGPPAIPYLIKKWEKYPEKHYSELLYKLGWEPELENLKVIYYNHLEQWDKLKEVGEPAINVLIQCCRWEELLSMGDAAIPKLVEIWQNNRQSENNSDIARTLFKLGWNPPIIESKLKFYYDAVLYKKLVEIGEPAVEFLHKHNLHRELAEIGKAGMPALLELFRNPRNHAIRDYIAEDILKVKWIPETNEDKVTYYLIHKNWVELVKLGEIAIPLLVDILNVNYSYLWENSAIALEKLGDISTNALNELLVKVNKESRDTDLSYNRVVKLQNRITDILIKIGTDKAILSILNSFPHLEFVRNTHTEKLAIKLSEILPNYQNSEIIEARNNTIDILIERFNNGYKYAKILEAFGASDNDIVNIYIKLIRKLERPTDYQEIFDYFTKNNCWQAVDTLFAILSVPKSGNERFYQDIIITIGKIADKSAIPRLKELLNTHWAMINHVGKVEKYIDSKWIEYHVNQAVSEIQSKYKIENKTSNIYIDKNSNAKILTPEIKNNSFLSEKDTKPITKKSYWWKFWTKNAN